MGKRMTLYYTMRIVEDSERDEWTWMQVSVRYMVHSMYLSDVGYNPTRDSDMHASYEVRTRVMVSNSLR